MIHACAHARCAALTCQGARAMLSRDAEMLMPRRSISHCRRALYHSVVSSFGRCSRGGTASSHAQARRLCSTCRRWSHRGWAISVARSSTTRRWSSTSRPRERSPVPHCDAPARALPSERSHMCVCVRAATPSGTARADATTSSSAHRTWAGATSTRRCAPRSSSLTLASRMG